MNGFTIFFIAFGLSMDAFAISVSSGATSKALHLKNAFRVAFFFGFFQMIMPLVGWLGGIGLHNLISAFDHWIVFLLLLFIGGKMIKDSLKPISSENQYNPYQTSTLLILSIATSLDALAVGFSIALLRVSIITPMLVIGVITFTLSFLGVYLGNLIGHLFENKIKLLGGLILIAIGLRILFQHLF